MQQKHRHNIEKYVNVMFDLSFCWNQEVLEVRYATGSLNASHVCAELPVKWLKELEPETSCMKGQPMYLTCELNKERDVTWKRNGANLKKQAGKIVVNIIGMQHALTIQNATEDDAGLYSCEVDGQEDVKTTTNIKVIGKQLTPSLKRVDW